MQDMFALNRKSRWFPANW